MPTQRTREDLRGYFERGDKPSESQFADLIESCYNHLDDNLISGWKIITDIEIFEGQDDGEFSGWVIESIPSFANELNSLRFSIDARRIASNNPIILDISFWYFSDTAISAYELYEFDSRDLFKHIVPVENMPVELEGEDEVVNIDITIPINLPLNYNSYRQLFIFFSLENVDSPSFGEAQEFLGLEYY